MAASYQTGVSSSPTNLLQTLVAWLAGQGWTVNQSEQDGAGWRAHLQKPGSLNVNLRAAHNERIWPKGGGGYHDLGNGGYGINRIAASMTEAYNDLTDALTTPANAAGRSNVTPDATDLNVNPLYSTLPVSTSASRNAPARSSTRGSTWGPTSSHSIRAPRLRNIPVRRGIRAASCPVVESTWQSSRVHWAMRSGSGCGTVMVSIPREGGPGRQLGPGPS